MPNQYKMTGLSTAQYHELGRLLAQGVSYKEAMILASNPPTIAADGSKSIGCMYCPRAFETADECDAHELTHCSCGRAEGLHDPNCPQWDSHVDNYQEPDAQSA